MADAVDLDAYEGVVVVDVGVMLIRASLLCLCKISISTSGGFSFFRASCTKKTNTINTLL